MCHTLALQYLCNADPSPWTFRSNPEIASTYLERKINAFLLWTISEKNGRIPYDSNVLLTFTIIPHLYISNKKNVLELRIQDIQRLEVLAMSCVSGKKTYSTKLSKFSSTLRPLPSSYLEIRTWRTEGGIAYPRLYRASLSSVESIFPLRSLSNLSKMA